MFPNRKAIIEIDWTAHELLLSLGTYFKLEKYLLMYVLTYWREAYFD